MRLRSETECPTSVFEQHEGFQAARVPLLPHRSLTGRANSGPSAKL